MIGCHFYKQFQQNILHLLDSLKKCHVFFLHISILPHFNYLRYPKSFGEEPIDYNFPPPSSSNFLKYTGAHEAGLRGVCVPAERLL